MKDDAVKSPLPKSEKGAWHRAQGFKVRCALYEYRYTSIHSGYNIIEN